MIVCRFVFVSLVLAIALAWTQLNYENRFFAVVLTVTGTAVLALSDTCHSVCKKILYIGWIVIGFATFTWLTGYEIGWQHGKVVDKTSGTATLAVGICMVLVGTIVKGLGRNG